MILQRKPSEIQREICFYADYQGMIKFKEEEEPTVKELKNIKLGCFTFQFKETGDFEMMIEKNVTVAPLAEVITGAESGMGGMTPIVETTTITVTMPYTSYVTTYLTTVEGQVSTITQTITQYQTRTLTKIQTKWKTTTTTVVTTVKREVPIITTTTVTKTVTKIVTKTVGGGYYGEPLAQMESAVILYYPYSEFIFICS